MITVQPLSKKQTKKDDWGQGTTTKRGEVREATATVAEPSTTEKKLTTGDFNFCNQTGEAEDEVISTCTTVIMSNTGDKNDTEWSEDTAKERTTSFFDFLLDRCQGEEDKQKVISTAIIIVTKLILNAGESTEADISSIIADNDYVFDEVTISKDSIEKNTKTLADYFGKHKTQTKALTKILNEVSKTKKKEIRPPPEIQMNQSDSQSALTSGSTEEKKDDDDSEQGKPAAVAQMRAPLRPPGFESPKSQTSKAGSDDMGSQFFSVGSGGGRSGVSGMPPVVGDDGQLNERLGLPPLPPSAHAAVVPDESDTESPNKKQRTI